MEMLKEKGELAVLEEVSAGMKGGLFFDKLITPPAMTFVDGYPKEVSEKLAHKGFTQGTPEDAWNIRRQK